MVFLQNIWHYGGLERERDCRDAGQPTIKTGLAAEYVSNMTPFHRNVPDLFRRAYNKIARANNKQISRGSIMPIHDIRNIPVTGFPQTFHDLIRPGHRESPRSQLGGLR